MVVQECGMFHGWNTTILTTEADVLQVLTVSVHHVQPSFFFGYETAPKGNVKIATQEKALIDFLYLSPAKSKLFRSLPELELPKRFDMREARHMISLIRSRRRRKRVLGLFEDLISGK